MKVSELSGATLDFWVARAEGYTLKPCDTGYRVFDAEDDILGRIGERPNTTTWLHWSSDWAQAGPIIEREGICIERRENDDGSFSYRCPHWSMHTWSSGYLIAAMRAFVGSKFGEDVPDSANDALPKQARRGGVKLDDLINDPMPLFSRLTSHEPKDGYNWEPYVFNEGGHYVEGDTLFRARIKIAAPPKD